MIATSASFFEHSGQNMPNHDIFSYKFNGSLLSIRGKDALSFLQGMSTNDISNLSHGPLHSSLVNQKGRLVDHLVILQDNENILIISSRPDAKLLIAWLEQFHFIEDFSLGDVSANYQPYFLVSKNSQKPCDSFLLWESLFDNNISIYLSLHGPRDYVELSSDQFLSWRVQGGMPSFPQEINENYMPQNVGLTKFISLTKGCYIRQEVIAKAITYQKSPKELCAFRVDKDIFLGLKQGSLLIDKEARVAIISSLLPSFDENALHGLAISGANSQHNSELLCNAQFIFPKKNS